MITLDDARRIMAVPGKKRYGTDSTSNAFADAGENLIAQVRKDGTWIRSIDI